MTTDLPPEGRSGTPEGNDLAAGTPGPTQPLQPYPWVAGCPAGPVGPWLPAALPTGSIEALRAWGDAERASVVGHWTGPQHSVDGTTHPVAFSFEATGHYAGMCLATECAALIYWGTDFDYPQKQYRLPGLTVDGVLSGTIDLAAPPSAAMGEDPNNPPYITVFDFLNVELDASRDRLRFDAVISDSLRAHYELWRCP